MRRLTAVLKWTRQQVRFYMPPQSTLLQHAAALIEHRTGLSTRRRGDLQMLLTEIAGDQLAAFTHQLQNATLDQPIWQGIIRALAIGETYFFRDDTHFQALRRKILPALIMKRRQQHDFTLNLWSVGCATGEEPYSLAILLYDLLPDLSRWQINLIATDINAQALEIARRGIYRPWSFRQTDIQNSGHFERVEDCWQIQSHIRQMVTFQQNHLLEGTGVGYGQFDLIFCRNVLLYFSPEHAVAAEAVLRESLVPGGWLFLGHSELVRGQPDAWLMNQFPGSPIYQKPNGVQTSVQVQPDTPLPPAESHTYDDAVRAYHAKQRDQTEQMLLRLLAAQPDHAKGWALLACLSADRHQPESAHHRLDHALALDPLLADAHYLRALLYREDGQIEPALQSLRAALYANRSHVLAGYMLGTLYMQSGDFERAVKFWENARHALLVLPPQQPLSDLSELTAGRLNALITEQLAGWQG